MLIHALPDHLESKYIFETKIPFIIGLVKSNREKDYLNNYNDCNEPCMVIDLDHYVEQDAGNKDVAKHNFNQSILDDIHNILDYVCSMIDLDKVTRNKNSKIFD